MASTRTRHVAAQIVLTEDPDHVGFIGFMDNGKFSVHDQAMSNNNIWKSEPLLWSSHDHHNISEKRWA